MNENLKFVDIGKDIGNLLEVKNMAYGDSFSKSYKILEILYPDGISIDQYKDLLTITRIIDKLFRISTNNDPLGESPYKDIAGYSILSIWRKEMDKIRQDSKLGNDYKKLIRSN